MNVYRASYCWIYSDIGFTALLSNKSITNILAMRIDKQHKSS